MPSRIMASGAGKSRAGKVTAYSYIRFSGRKQEKGDSLRRQTELRQAWLARHPEVTLDESLSLADLGVPAYRGENALVGNLRVFLEAVGRTVAPGSVLLVESFDRISRQGIDEGYELVKKILKAGVRIVTLSPEREYDREATRSLSKGALEIQLILERAAEESERKSERIREAWKNKRDAARERRAMPPRKSTGRVRKGMTDMLPAWVRVREDGEMELIPERARAVRRIFKLATDGYGTKRISVTLAAVGHKPFGKSGRWKKEYVHAILADRRAVGEYQPRDKDDEPVGKPIARYYPAAVTEDVWLAARAGLVSRRCVGEGKSQKQEPEERKKQREKENKLIKELSIAQAAKRLGRSETWVRIRRFRLGISKKREKKATPGEPFVNLFKGLLREARSGVSYMVIMRQDIGGRRRVLVKSEARDDRSPCYSFPYPVFEEALLREMREIDPNEILGEVEDDSGPNVELAAEGELTLAQSELVKLRESARKHGFSATIDGLIREWEVQEAEAKARLLDARHKRAKPLSASWGECKSLLTAVAKAPDKADARTRLSAALRRVVDSVWVLVVPNGLDRFCLVQMFFHTGAGQCERRDYMIYLRPTRSNGKVLREGYYCGGAADGSANPSEYDTTGMFVDDLRDKTATLALAGRLAKCPLDDWDVPDGQLDWYVEQELAYRIPRSVGPS